MDKMDLNNMVVDHRKPWVNFWIFFINLLSIATGFVYAHFAAYRHQDSSIFSEGFMIFVEFVYFCDMILHFVLSFPDPRGTLHPPIMKLDLCRKNYLNGDFVSHLIPFMPL
jgi:hypothetical protein